MKKTIISVLSVLFILVGCSTPIKNLPEEYKPDENDHSIIYGEILFHSSVYKYPDENFIMSLEGDITVENLDEGKIYSIKPFKSGSKYFFSVLLPEGKYKITSVRWGSVTGKHPSYYFNIDKSKSLYYIGDFELSIEDEYIYPMIMRDLFSNYFKRINLVVEVKDLFEDAKLTFEEKYKNIKKQSIKSVVTKES